MRAALYALGTLTRDEARAFEDHIAEGCAECEAELRASEAVAGRLAFGAAGAEPPEQAAFELLEKLQMESATHIEGKSGLEKTAGGYLSVRAPEGDWLDTGGGVYIKRLFSDLEKGSITSLYRLDPGTQCASHRHRGVEECLVLEGDFRVNGEVFGPGDYRVCMPGTIDADPFTIGGTLLLIVEGTDNQELVA